MVYKTLTIYTDRLIMKSTNLLFQLPLSPLS